MSDQSRKLPLRFGIDSLDRLINPKPNANNSPQDPFQKATWTAAIVGPDGCGKSLLSLHLASTYWKDHRGEHDPPRIIYLSTDLSFGQACGQWNNFGLDFPDWRERAVRQAYENCDRRSKPFDLTADRLSLELLKPHAGDDGQNRVLDSLLGPSGRPRNSVYFLDLQAETAGDDWEFVNHLIGLLPKRANAEGDTNLSRHLLVVDAVEGLETLVGDRDAYGQSRDRRSRVAQLIRRATAIGVHILFVVEEPKDDSRLPEQFVTDLVIRLRHSFDGEYAQRTVEVEKCRAIAHVRGLHELSIRPGAGTATGRMWNLDDPRILWKDRHGTLFTDVGCKYLQSQGVFNPDFIVANFQRRSEEDRYAVQSRGPVQYLSHIKVIPSLYFESSKLRANPAKLSEPKGQPSFNLDPVDLMLRSSKNPTPQSSIALLLGETGTYKGRLARRFLAESFRALGNQEQNINDSDLGVSVLLTTRYMDHARLVTRLALHVGIDSSDSVVQTRNLERLSQRVLCHRFGNRHFTPGAFLEIVKRYLEEAQKIVFGKTNQRFHEQGRPDDHPLKSAENRRTQSHRIRFVLEDWSLLLATYPSLSREPLLLPSLLTLFRREGVSCLIVSTEPGQPGAATHVEPNQLRSLDETQILTWDVPFYGDRRVAITTHSVGRASRTPMICELSPPRGGSGEGSDELLVANRHFDLYADVDLGTPRRVPLIVRLYLGNHASSKNANESGEFVRLLEDTFTQLFPAPSGQASVILDPYTEYNRLFTFAAVLDDAHLDHTLVFQLDEFWAILDETPKQGANSTAGPNGVRRRLYDLGYYWRTADVAWVKPDPTNQEAVIRIVEAGTNPDEDAFGAFHPHAHAYTPESEGQSDYGVPPISSNGPLKPPIGGPAVRKQTQMQRKHFFVAPVDGSPTSGSEAPIYRVPYVWDFGMLLADRDLWKRYAKMETSRKISIGAIWNRLCPKDRSALRLDEAPSSQGDQQSTVEWIDFLDACQKIGEQENIPAFDVDLSTVETLSCWVLELWASFQSRSAFNAFHSLTEHENPANGPCLETLVTKCEASLYQALVQLVLSCPHLRARDRQVYREHASGRAVASREWYHTASAMMKQFPERRLVPLSNCGSYSVRGDWSLAVAAGSRSEIVAHRALDLLSSRRNNLLRLQDGIGLPVRDVLPDVHNGDIPTAMRCFDDEEQRPFQLNYRDVCSLGRAGRGDKFSWLWRSRIKHYERDCLYWRRWIARMIEEQHLWFPWELRENKLAVRKLLASSPEKISLKENDAAEAASDHPLINKGLPDFRRLCNIICSALRDEIPRAD